MRTRFTPAGSGNFSTADRAPVITGIGIISAVACDAESFASSLFSGCSGVSPVAGDAPGTIAGIVPAAAFISDFPEPGGDWASRDRSIRFAVAAARQAARQANLSGADPERTGACIASSKGGMLSFCRERSAWRAGGGYPSPNFFADYWPSSPAAAVALDTGCRGPVFAPVAACAAGTHALIAAARMIASGEADVVLAGATEASLTPLVCSGFRRLGVLAPDGVCRPFDRRRSGFVIGEGAAVMTVESRAHAEERGVPSYAAIAGWAMASDAHGLTALDSSGERIAAAIGTALTRSGVDPAGVQYINAHATGTKMNDTVESRAIRQAFGWHTNEISISGTKPATGHLLGAAGAIEAAVCLLAMQHNMIPPTLNLVDVDPECGLPVVAGSPLSRAVDTAVNLSFGFGGQIGVLVFKKDFHTD